METSSQVFLRIEDSEAILRAQEELISEEEVSSAAENIVSAAPIETVRALDNEVPETGGDVWDPTPAPAATPKPSIPSTGIFGFGGTTGQFFDPVSGVLMVVIGVLIGAAVVFKITRKDRGFRYCAESRGSGRGSLFDKFW